MRQWKSITSSDYIIDKRSREDILKQIQTLAASYVPEWQFDEKDPDIGSVLALLYTDEMEENIRRCNMLLERDHIELMNMLGISLKPAFPAHGIVLLKLSQNTISGFKLKKGVKLLGGEEDEENIVFETSHSIYVTESQLKSVFMVSGKNGKVIPLCGNFPPVSYVKESAEQEELTLSPFTLFDFQKEGYGKYGLLFYHSYLFDVRDNDILMRIGGAPDLAKEIADGKYRLCYYGEEGFREFEQLNLMGEDCIAFRKSEECRKVMENEEACSLLLLEPVEIPTETVTVSDLSFSSIGESRRPELVFNGTSELDPGSFLPFGETIGLYSECYIGHDEYFSKPNAEVTLRFYLEFETHLVTIPRQQQEEELKIIKKRKKKDIFGAPAEIFADEISIEYYNGIGWRTLPLREPARQIFSRDISGMREIHFRCPDDWKELEAGGFFGKTIRIQVTRSDNCYYQPALHHYPVIRDLKVSYTYGDRMERPKKLVSFQGSRRYDLTAAMAENEVTPIFSISSYQETSLYLGFDKKMEDGPIGLFIKSEELEGYPKGKLVFSYSTRDGFSRLKLSDYTDGLSHTGILLFMPPTDMAKKTLEGQEAYWIKITDEKQYLEEHPLCRPCICDIQMNAAAVDNVDTMTEDAYYIDAFGPDMKFSLHAQNILALQVWVNEMGLFSETEMRRMLAEDAENTKAEYSFLGEIEEFYVKWKEVDNFDRSMPGDRHYVVDRMNGRLLFGDGVHVQIPRNTKGTAFKVVMSRCDGELANIEAGKITASLGGLMFVEQITNPVETFGGMNMETVEEALRRGTSVLNSRNRLVSAQDYEREALNFSARIAQAKVITDRKKDGSVAAGSISLVLLMQDYANGEQSFLHMQQRLGKHIAEKCELSAAENEFFIVQPIFAEISVEAWVRVIHTDDSFEVQRELCRTLEEYLDPLSHNGWEIGRMVRPEQIRLRLHMEKGKALLRRMMVTARYMDADGYHEEALEALSANPYVLVVSGTHKIHFE